MPRLLSKTLQRSVARVALSLFALLGVKVASAQLPIYELTAVSQVAAKSGTTFELRPSAGSRLDEVTELRFSHPGISAELLTDDPLPYQESRQPRYGHFRVTVAEEVPAGRYDVRCVGRHGVSNPRVLFVHALDSDALVSPSTNAAEPTALATKTMVHAKTATGNVHYYQVDVDAGSTLRIDCLAARVDSAAIPVLTLLDAKGRTVMTQTGSDDIDPTLVVESESPASFTLAVHDAIYRGGEEYPYLLVAQDAKHAAAFDDDVSQGLPTLDSVTAITIPDGLDARATAIEETSNAKTLTLPTTVKAWFDNQHDVDTYEFTANKGDRFVFDVVSERIGQPTDCRLVIEQAIDGKSETRTWKTLATVDDMPNINDAGIKLWSADCRHTLSVPESATYRAVVKDLDTGEMLSRRQQYYLDIRRPEPGFDLIAYRPFLHKDANAFRQAGSQLFRGGTEAIRVFAIRKDGFNGAIELTVDGLPTGVTAGPAVIAANQTQTQITVAAATDAPAAVFDAKVTGKARIGEGEYTVEAKPAAIRWGRGRLREFVRSRQTTALTLAVSDKDTLPVSVHFEGHHSDGAVAELKKGQSLKIPVKLTRADNGKVNYVLRARDLPPKVTCGDLTIAADKETGELEIKAAGDAPAGTYSLWFQAETKLKVKPNPQSLERAQAYRAHLQKLSEDPANAPQLDAIKAAIKTADQRVNAAQGSAKDQDLTLFLPSPNVTLRVVDP